MSIRAMNAVWQESKHKGSALLLLLAIADYAHDDGSNAFPSLPTLAGKIRMSERNVRYLLRDLVASGEVVIEGATSAGTHRMRVVLPGLTPVPQASYLPACALCEARPGIHRHHKIPREHGGKGTRGNLISVCEECHTALHLPGKSTLTPAGQALADGASLTEVRALLNTGANIAPANFAPRQLPAPERQFPGGDIRQIAPDPLINRQEPSEDDDTFIRRVALRYRLDTGAARVLAKLCRDEAGRLRRPAFEEVAFKNRAPR